MIDTTPLISLPAFAIGFIVVLFAARACVEIYLHYSAQKKSPQDVAASSERVKTASKAVQRYYNKNIKGA